MSRFRQAFIKFAIDRNCAVLCEFKTKAGACPLIFLMQAY